MIATVTLNPAVDVVTSVPHVIAAGKLRCDVPRRAPGGGGVNVSRAIAALGGRSTAVFTCGGANGALLHESLLAIDGIACRPLRIAGDTRENLLVRERASGHEFHFVMPGPALDEAEWRAALRVVETLDPAPRYVVASGELPRGVPVDFYARLSGAALARGSRLVVDAHGASLRAALAHGVWMVKPNVGELAELIGDDLKDERSLVAAARGLVEDGGAEVVLLSLGRGGAILTTRDEAPVHLRAPVVRQASRVGAGDATVAGLVLALDRGAELRDAVEAGIVAGAATVMTPALEPLRPADVDALSAQLRAPTSDPEGVPG